MKKIIGIDIGGTKTSIGIVDIKYGKILKKISIPSKKNTNDKKNLDYIISKTLSLAKNSSIKKIGIGVPELINNKGIIRGSYNFQWQNKNLAQYFPKSFLVKVDSDVRCHLRAEKFYGHGKKNNNFIYINIGTGLSYSHYKNNMIYSGASGFAIHFASSNITLYDPKKEKKISLIPEDLYSGKSIMKYLKNIKTSKKRSVYLNNISESLASLIGNLVNSVDPSLIVLGGGVVLNNSEFKKLLIFHTRKFIFCDDVKSIKILLSKLKIDTGVIGAAAIFR
ncbi:ROK family protein [Alphaproteobacteria bacterium]|nr:ROK family protein [Alphaproteobacteria bacterium]